MEQIFEPNKGQKSYSADKSFQPGEELKYDGYQSCKFLHYDISGKAVCRFWPKDGLEEDRAVSVDRLSKKATFWPLTSPNEPLPKINVYSILKTAAKYNAYSAFWGPVMIFELRDNVIYGGGDNIPDSKWDMYGHIFGADGETVSDDIDLYPDSNMKPWSAYGLPIPAPDDHTKSKKYEDLFGKEVLKANEKLILNPDDIHKKDKEPDKTENIISPYGKNNCVAYEDLRDCGVVDSSFPAGSIKPAVNIYEILENHPDFKVAYSNKYGVIELTCLFHNKLITAINGDGICIVYDAYGYLWDGEKRVNDVIDLFPNMTMDLWTSIDNPDFVPIIDDEMKSLKVWLCNRVSSMIFSPVCGYGIIDSVDDRYIKLKAMDDGEKYIFDYYGYYYGRDNGQRMKSDLPISKVVLLQPNGDLKVKWIDWYDATKWRARNGETFYYMNETLEVTEMFEAFDDKCNALYKVGNYFQTKIETITKIGEVKSLFRKK